MGAAEENLMVNSGPKINADAVMVEVTEEVAGVTAKGRAVVAGDALVITGAEPQKSDRFAKYYLPRLDNGDIRVSDLVWGKLEDASSSKDVSVEENDTTIVHSNHYKPRRGRGRPCKWTHWDGIVESMEKKATSDLYDFCKYGYPEETQMFGSADELIVLEKAKRRHMHKNHNADPMELLSQLCSVAIEPMNRNNLSKKIFSYFSYYRNYVVTTSNEVSVIGKVKPKRGRDRTSLHSPELEMTQMQDSYWSELSLHNDPTYSLRSASTRTRPMHERRGITRKVYIFITSNAACGIHSEETDTSDGKTNAKMTQTHEVKGTALVLSFVRLSSRDVPMLKGLSVLLATTALLDRLVNMPFYLGPQEASNPVTHPEANGF
ncbi:hypothetical protein HU200_031912 [Digitaria exilis]|uniref:Uncharacterized protein n=1 Tax=Digitaria exilis TaxID=1010633 RepID=A0A835BXW1_9POAL|nr:hypothetical protein HU200_031912 [Digitaria exilis]